MERQFGEFAEEAIRVLIDAGHTTHVRSAEAKDASRLTSNEVYGASFWLNLPRQVSGRLEPVLPNVVRIRPASSRYSLLVWNGTVIFPVKVMDRTAKRADSMRVRVSDLRRQLFALNPPAEPDYTLFDLINGSNESDAQHRAEAIADDSRVALGSSADSMMIVAYVCTADGGLQAVHVGSGTLDSDGYIRWTERQSLSLLDDLDLASKPRLVAGEAFDDAPALQPALGLVGDEKEATGSGDSTPVDSDIVKFKLIPGSSLAGTAEGESLGPMGGVTTPPDDTNLA
jgi:hypothetical protein